MVTRESTGGKGLAISSRCWLNAGRATNDCGRTLRVASYEGGKAEEVWEFSGGRDWRRSRKFCGKKRGERRMHQTPPARTFSIHSRIDLKISSSSSMFLSLSLPTPFRSFVFFCDWNVLVGLFPAFFRRSPRSFVLLRFPNSLTTNGNSAQKPTEREFLFEKIRAPNSTRGRVEASLWFLTNDIGLDKMSSCQGPLAHLLCCCCCCFVSELREMSGAMRLLPCAPTEFTDVQWNSGRRVRKLNESTTNLLVNQIQSMLWTRLEQSGALLVFLWFSFRLECKSATIERTKKRTRQIHVNRKTHKEKQKNSKKKGRWLLLPQSKTIE